MFLVTVPHCSVQVPAQVRDRLHPETNLREITEPGMERIAEWPDSTMLLAQAHQCFGNVNRYRDDFNRHTGKPYPSAIGILPDCDFRGTPLYRSGAEPSLEEREELLRTYYDPFYEQLDALLQSGRFTHVVDAHAMNAHHTGYEEASKDPEIRPDICISNGGDEQGDPVGDGLPVTFPPDRLRALCARIKDKGYDCAMNVPFRGGVIIRHCAAYVPSVQLEVNKSLYMTADDGDILPERVEKLREDLGEVMGNSV